LIMMVFAPVVSDAAGDVVVWLEFVFINAQSTYGRLQKAPPIAPKRIIVANVSKSLFGAPNEAPNIGKKKVRNETGINCFRLGSQQFNFLEPYFTKKADISGIPINVNNAPDQWYIIVILDPSEVLPSGILVIITINNPTHVPVTIPAKIRSLFLMISNPRHYLHILGNLCICSRSSV